ncbi:MAG: PilZ domain-containing protein [Vulcanimicrobiota bacterium]
MAIGEFFSQFRSLLFGSEDLLRNRRHQPRLALELPVIVDLGHGKQQGEVRDFGPNGLRLHMPLKLAKNRKLNVEVMGDSGLDGAASLGCRVAWCRATEKGFHIGCRYDDKPEALATSWVQMLLLERHHRSKERKDRRVETTLPAILLDKVNPPHNVFVIDLGLGGARVYSPGAWSPVDTPRLSFSMPGQGPSVDFAVEVVESRLMDNAGYTYRLRFRDPDSKRMALLRRMLMQLLEGVRKAGRSRPNDVIQSAPVSKSQPASTSAAGPLGAAVRGPAKPPGTKSRGVSKYLQAPELPAPKPKTAEAPPPPIQPPAPAIDSEPTGRVRQSAPNRMQLGLLPQEGRERRRGWLAAALEGWFPQQELPNDFLFRPTHAFLRCLGPLFPGFPGLISLHPWSIDTDLDLGYEIGPGLLWTDRRNLCRWWMARRAVIPWFRQSLATRERLERRTGNLRSRAFQMLSLLACGGPASVRQMLVCAQIAVGLARHYGIDDPMVLNQLRLAAMLKDVGEALLFVACQPRAVRDRYTLHINGLDHGEPEIAELTGDWSGFYCPNDLLINRLRLEPATLEVMSCHPWVSDKLLAKLGFPLEVRTTVRYHHEAWGGCGYPEGLGEEEIPWGARCLAVADGFASGMTYLGTPERSFGQLSQLEGSFYEPALIAALHKYLVEVGVMQ